MEIPFHKYQGTGNDFIIIDNRQMYFPKNDTNLVASMCDRKFGIGADGLLLLENHDSADFKMVYYNSDGNLSTMCGNGGRCIAHFSNYLGISKENAFFEAVDGMHEASILGNTVSLKMNNVTKIETSEKVAFLNTGSPHHVQLVEDVTRYDVFSEGRKIRNDRYGKEGANVNFVTQTDTDTFSVRTYERGVEDETLSCGTGVTAVAIAMFETGKTTQQKVTLNTQGGVLQVSFSKENGIYKEVFLEGPAIRVFKGTWA
ncbi:diaminopimelate epimerase [Cochleicola gelatinilyticus]|uniref:Diaminopimelate epimerase n=1 Tax=Cochleicola gelatinilyticus TaxID=1763537 RepID=A0A167HVC7_9FLAO|nr:diaminopimelate epimerase [Cochleicola gelatinilyticus]OAB78999.1 diaminopimelate epimerase [Cochleicola gelatinilyticus]